MASQRRDFFKQAGLGMVGVSLLRTNAEAQQARTGKRPKNIIFMVSDGMSAGVLPLAELTSQYENKRATNWAQLLREPRAARGMFDQASLNSCVTDSAAASSSWGCGSRVNNGSINTLPDGTSLTPVGKLAKEKGLMLGLVTTTAIWDATPAGFAASVQARSMREPIAEQYRNRVDVIMGGGREAFTADKRSDKQDLVAAYRDSGYLIAPTKPELSAVKPGSKVLALFGDGPLPYSIDHVRNENDRTNIPTLAEMTAIALRSMGDAKKGFLLQVEGARIDHSAHANDAAAVIRDQLAFDAAVGVALDFARRRGDTLVVLCTDHGNSNPGLNSMGSATGGSDECLRRAMRATASFSEMAKQLGNRSDYNMDANKVSDAKATAAERVAAVVKQHHNVDLKPEHASAIARAAGGEKGIVLNAQQDTLVGVMGQVMSNHTGVGFVGTSHTADFVTSTAFGPGCEHFEGLLRNTDVFQKLTTLMGTPFKNPAADGRPITTASHIPVGEPEFWLV
ncbi:MAG: alkaline phosphatase [Bryobacterales bacterium]|nr:alkaline phosphatase [Bryobacterales bacterium]